MRQIEARTDGHCVATSVTLLIAVHLLFTRRALAEEPSRLPSIEWVNFASAVSADSRDSGFHPDDEITVTGCERASAFCKYLASYQSTGRLFCDEVDKDRHRRWEVPEDRQGAMNLLGGLRALKVKQYPCGSDVLVSVASDATVVEATRLRAVDVLFAYSPDVRRHSFAKLLAETSDAAWRATIITYILRRGDAELVPVLSDRLKLEKNPVYSADIPATIKALENPGFCVLFGYLKDQNNENLVVCSYACASSGLMRVVFGRPSCEEKIPALKIKEPSRSGLVP